MTCILTWYYHYYPNHLTYHIFFMAIFITVIRTMNIQISIVYIVKKCITLFHLDYQADGFIPAFNNVIACPVRWHGSNIILSPSLLMSCLPNSNPMEICFVNLLPSGTFEFYTYHGDTAAVACSQYCSDEDTITSAKKTNYIFIVFKIKSSVKWTIGSCMHQVHLGSISASGKYPNFYWTSCHFYRFDALYVLVISHNISILRVI